MLIHTPCAVPTICYVMTENWIYACGRFWQNVIESHLEHTTTDPRNPLSETILIHYWNKSNNVKKKHFKLSCPQANVTADANADAELLSTIAQLA